MRRAGLLDEMIEIKRIVVTVNRYGERIENYNTYIKTRANVINDGGNKSVINNEIFNSYSKTFQVRYYVDVKDTDIIVWQKREYRIISVEKRRNENDILIKTELINE